MTAGFALPLFAVVAGLLSFSSPCCLPLLPGYLSYVSALPVSELGDRQARLVTLRAALLFVGGFTLVFTVLGVAVQRLGSVLYLQITAFDENTGESLRAMLQDGLKGGVSGIVLDLRHNPGGLVT